MIRGTLVAGGLILLALHHHHTFNGPHSEPQTGRFDIYQHGALRPCATEDSVNCYWDAQTMGNGIGTDFIVLEN